MAVSALAGHFGSASGSASTMALKSAMPSGRGFLALNSSWMVGSRLDTSPDSLLWSDDGRVAVKRLVLVVAFGEHKLQGTRAR